MRVILGNAALYKWEDPGTYIGFVAHYSRVFKKFKRKPVDFPAEPIIPGIMCTVPVQSSEKNKKKKDGLTLACSSPTLRAPL